jgi:hypothetical protein
MRINKSGNSNNTLHSQRTNDNSAFTSNASFGNRTMVLHGLSGGHLVFATNKAQQLITYNTFASNTIIEANIDLINPTSATEWIEHNRNKLLKYSGMYVAITHNGLVASSNDFDEVFLKARGKGAMNPLVFKVPKPTVHSKIASVKLH